MVIPKKSGGVWITVNYTELSQVSSLSQLPIPSVNQFVDSLGKGLSLFGLVSSFLHSNNANEDTVPLAVFCTPTGLYELLVMSQGSSASPVWFVKLIAKVITRLTQASAYLDNVMFFYSDPTAHV